MPSHEEADLWALSDLATPWCIHVVATLRIADHIEAGVCDVAHLAARAGCDADALHRVLRHLAERGVFEEPEPGKFRLNGSARTLLDDSARLGLDLDGIGGRMALAWGSLLTAVRTGRTAFHTIFGLPFWEDLQAHPEVSAGFDALMGPAGHGIPDPEVLVSRDWESVRTVVDVGGGTGALLAGILRARPHVRGTLVDLPSTAARAGMLFEASGVADRVTVAGQSFFEPLPRGADVYLLKKVLSDWPDPEAGAILARCAEAAGPTGRVVVVGDVSLEEEPGPSPALLMLVLVGGKDRNLSEFRSLARSAGLEVTSTGRQPDGRSLVECRPLGGEGER